VRKLNSLDAILKPILKVYDLFSSHSALSHEGELKKRLKKEERASAQITSIKDFQERKLFL